MLQLELLIVGLVAGVCLVAVATFGDRVLAERRLRRVAAEALWHEAEVRASFRLARLGLVLPDAGQRIAIAASGIRPVSDRPAGAGRTGRAREISLVLLLAGAAALVILVLPVALQLIPLESGAPAGAVLELRGTPSSPTTPTLAYAGPASTLSAAAPSTVAPRGAPPTAPAGSGSTASPVAAAAVRAAPSPLAYVVRRGDTLSRIAVRFRTTVEAILDLNPEVSDPSLIVRGQLLQIPSAR